jgi:site-specific DNA-methyltransferase (adenine-specific)
VVSGGKPTPYYEAPDTALYLGDCRDLLPALADNSVDAIVTSPPYADARPDVPGPKPDEFAEWFAPVLAELYRVLAPLGGFMLNLGRLFRDGEEHSYIEDTLARARAVGWKRIDTVVWYKRNGQGHGRYLLNRHEFAFWLARDVNAYRGYDRDTRTPHAAATVDRNTRRFGYSTKGEPFGELRRRKPLHPDGARPASVYEGTVGRAKGIAHPTPMASDFASYLVCLACRPGGLVLDPFAGSGTTLRAAADKGRRSIGFELNEAHAAEAVDRLLVLPAA